MLKNVDSVKLRISSFFKNGIKELVDMSETQAEKHNGLRECKIDDNWALTYLHDVDEDGKFLWCEIVFSVENNGKYGDVLDGFALDIKDDADIFTEHVISQIENSKELKTNLKENILYDYERFTEPFGGELLQKYNYCQVYAVPSSCEDKKDFPYSVFIKLLNGNIEYLDDITQAYFDEMKQGNI